MTERQTFDVEGMSCTGCEETVTSALANVEGVRRVEADHERNEVEVVYDEGSTSAGELTDSIHQAGYDVPV